MKEYCVFGIVYEAQRNILLDVGSGGEVQAYRGKKMKNR